MIDRDLPKDSEPPTPGERDAWVPVDAKTYIDENGVERGSFGVPVDPVIAHREWVEMGRPRAS